jgi:hypothetical protein
MATGYGPPAAKKGRRNAWRGPAELQFIGVLRVAAEGEKTGRDGPGNGSLPAVLPERKKALPRERENAPKQRDFAITVENA